MFRSSNVTHKSLENGRQKQHSYILSAEMREPSVCSLYMHQIKQYPIRNYGRRPTRNRCWFSWEEESGTGLVTCSERVVTALPSMHCSAQHKATEEEGDRWTHGGGSSRMKCGRRVSGTVGGWWRRQRRTRLDGDELSVAYAPPGVTRHKSRKSSSL